MAVYFIDNNAVNQRAGWRTRRGRAPVKGRRRETFPGAGQRYEVKGPLMGRQIQIDGFLEAADKASLHGLIDSYEDMKADDALHSITIGGQTYQNVELIDIRQRGRIRPGGGGVLMPVQFVWEQLTR